MPLVRQEDYRRMLKHLPDALNHRCGIVTVDKTMIE
jgi:hypothetical protein